MGQLQGKQRREKRKGSDGRPVKLDGVAAVGEGDAFLREKGGFPGGNGRNRTAKPYGTGIKRTGIIQQGDQLPLIQQIGRGMEHRMNGGLRGVLRQQGQQLGRDGLSGGS